MASTSFEPAWDWPDSVPGGWVKDDPDEKSSGARYRPSGNAGSVPPNNNVPQNGQPQGQRRRTHYPPRQCRICLEIVQPTFESPSENLPEMLQGMPSVSYWSEDGGRLFRPCLCKGSQKYVHEGCLTSWRLQDPSQRRNYWQCPTCKYNYRLGRMTWGHRISSTGTQLALTFVIFFFVIFLLGYVADPIINIFLDGSDGPSYSLDGAYYVLEEDDSELSGWLLHLTKGLASLGLLGCAKIILTMNPFAWFNFRGSGLVGGRAGNSGRQRIQNLGWIAIMVGVATFLWAVWKGVRTWSKKTLARASERVMDVPLADDDDDDD